MAVTAEGFARVLARALLVRLPLPNLLLKLLLAGLAGLAAALPAGAAGPARCLTDCKPRIAIVSAFGAEADILVGQTRDARHHRIGGKRFTTGTLRGNPVVIVLSGVSIVNATLTTQQLIDHFRVERIVMSGIAGGIDPANHVGDVTVPDRWAMPMEVYWNADATPPAPCGRPGELGCLGLQLATGPDGRPLPPFAFDTPQGRIETGLFMRRTEVPGAGERGAAAFLFDYPVDPAMLEVARSLQPKLERCGPKAKRSDGSIDEKLCVARQPRLLVGGRGVSAPVFLANPQYRRYLHEVLQAQSFEMETAALAHVARVNRVPYIAFRSLSDLAGGEAFDADAGALFMSGLAETNEAAVTLAFLDAWRQRKPAAAKGRNAGGMPRRP